MNAKRGHSSTLSMSLPPMSLTCRPPGDVSLSRCPPAPAQVMLSLPRAAPAPDTANCCFPADLSPGSSGPLRFAPSFQLKQRAGA